VAQIVRRWPAFDGRKIVAVACDEQSQGVDEVRRELPADCEVIVSRNDPRLRETATLPLLLAAVRTAEPDAIFYAHTKGTNDPQASYVRGIMYWRNAMYHYLLDEPFFPGLVGRQLRDFPCVGTCRGQWEALFGGPYPSGLVHGTWMFCGTFFWFRADVLFAHPKWREVPNDRYGAEAYLAGLFGVQDACSIYQPWPDDRMPPMNPYEACWYQPGIDDPPTAADAAARA
jgi:hypothetical protein